MRILLLVAGIAASSLAALPAQAQWHGGYGGGYGWHGGYGWRGGPGYYGGYRGLYAPYYAPRVYYAPPPVYVVPPPVAYAPPPVYLAPAPRPVAHRPIRPRPVQPVSVPCTCAVPGAPAQAAILPALRPPVAAIVPPNNIYPPEAGEQPHIGN